MHNSLEHFLGAADGAGKILAHGRLLQKLGHLYAQLAPAHLGRASCVANYKSGIVVIHADNGAVAVKLRQMGPTLADEFSKKGVECNEVRIKVQAPENTRLSRTSTPHPLTGRSSRTLAELAESLPAGTLREALRTLVDRALIQE